MLIGAVAVTSIFEGLYPPWIIRPKKAFVSPIGLLREWLYIALQQETLPKRRDRSFDWPASPSNLMLSISRGVLF